MAAAAPKVDVGPDTTRRIAELMRDHSIEATRPTAADIAELSAALPAGTQVFLSAVPARPLSDLVGQSKAVRAAGFEPVPHLAARGLTSAHELDELLAALGREAGVKRALVIGGDADRARGPFASALEVIESGLLQKHGIVEIGIAGYPDGHPRVSSDVLERALAAKVEAAAQTGLAISIVTQFGFSAESIIRWIARVRDLGIEHRIRIGMAGPSSLATLLRYAKRCGVIASAQGLSRQAGLIKHLVGTSAPDTIIRPLAEEAGKLGKIAVHFFSFGGTGGTARWAAAVASGHIVLDRGEGFSVAPP